MMGHILRQDDVSANECNNRRNDPEENAERIT